MWMFICGVRTKLSDEEKVEGLLHRGRCPATSVFEGQMCCLFFASVEGLGVMSKFSQLCEAVLYAVNDFFYRSQMKPEQS